MNCVKCGAQIPEGTAFCPECGAGKPEQPKKKKNTAKKVLISILSLLLVVGLRYGIKYGITGLFNAAEDAKLSRTYEELDAMMAELDVVVTGYELGQWEDSTGSGPLLQPLLQNKSDKAIKDIEIAIATWDSLGLGVNVVFDDGERSSSNVAKVTYNDCDFAAGGTYGEDIGLGLSSTSKIPERIQAIPIKWTYADGTTEENPYYKHWLHKYQNQTNTRADLSDPQFRVKEELTEEELIQELKKEPLVVTACELAQWANGDLLCATVKNNGTATVKSMLLAYATFDAEGNPVCITWSDGEKAETNVVNIRMKDLALAPDGEYGSDKGVGLHADSAKVASFVAIPYYYEDIDGNTWENPYYEAWLDQYEAE